MKLNSLEDTKKLAEKIASGVKKGDVIALSGDLGAGKTTFSRFFINYLMGHEENVTSPTFNLVLPYETKDFTIWHFDLYRLNEAKEVEELGLYDAFDNGVSLIEWPEIISDILPENTVMVKFTVENGDRSVKCKGVVV